MAKKELSTLTFNERRAAQLWAQGFDVDGEPVTTKREIAKRCAMSEADLYKLFQRQDFCEEIDKHLTVQKNACARELMRTLPSAVRRLQKIIDEGGDREALQAAAKVLSIGGFSEHKVIDFNVNDTTGVIRGGFRSAEADFTDAIDADYTTCDDEDEE